MRAFYAGGARRLVDQLLARFDVANVVTVLRAQASQDRMSEDARRALVPVGWLVEPLADEVLGQHELAGAVDLLIRRSPDREQASALRAAYREYERTTDLPAFEHAVLADHAARADAALVAAGRPARTLLRFARRERSLACCRADSTWLAKRLTPASSSSPRPIRSGSGSCSAT